MSRFTVIPAVYVVFRREERILLLRRQNTGYKDGFYSLPAGHIDGGEPAVMAAVREAQEEVGVTLKVSDLRFVHVLHRVAEEKDHERVDFFFETTVWEGEPKNMEPQKCDDLSWFALNDLPDNLIPAVAQALQQITAENYYSDFDFD